jgi:hypothetical protein
LNANALVRRLKKHAFHQIPMIGGKAARRMYQHLMVAS